MKIELRLSGMSSRGCPKRRFSLPGAMPPSVFDSAFFDGEPPITDGACLTMWRVLFSVPDASKPL